MGYLGKISAVVSASTADFDAKLAKSAKEVGAFASKVQSNLTSASRSAAKALEGIYTPMQKFERSLQAAGSLKLSFKGFPGMIRDLDALQARLNSALSARQVAIVLRTTGMESVEKVRQSLNGLKSKDIEIIANFGGLEKLKELQKRVSVDVDIAAAVKRVSEMDAAFAAAKKKVGELNAVPVGPKVSTAGLDTLRQELQKTTAAAGQLMGGEYTGQKSLEKSIAGVSERLLKAQQDLLKATAVRDALLTGASGKNANPADLKKAQTQVDTFTEENKALAEQLKTLEGYRDQIKKLRSDIRRAESVASSPSATGEDRAKAFKDMEAAQRAATKAAKDLQRQLTARYGLSISVADLNELVARGSKAGDLLQRLKPLMDNLGKSDFSAAADRMRKMQSVAVQITEPLKAAVGKLAGLGVAVESAFSPALKNTQKNVEALNTAIESQTRPSAALDKYFLDVQSQVERTIKSIERLNEVSLLASQTKTGREFVFEQPVLKEAIDKSASIGNQAAALPAEVLKANPQVAESLVDLRKKTDDAVAAYASLLAVMDRKTSSPKEQQAARDALNGFVQKLVEAQAVAEKEVQLRINVAAAEKAVAALREKLAGSTKLTIGGTQGIVNDLDSLRKRLDATLTKRQVDVVLKATGLPTLEDLRRRIDGLQSKDVEIVAKFGGLDKLKDLQRKVSVDADVNSALENISRLTAAFDAARDNADRLKASQIAVSVDSTALDDLRQKLTATTADAGKLLGGEPVGANALEQAIARIGEELRQTQAELANTASQRDALLRSAEAGAVTPQESPVESNRTQELTQRQSNLSEKLAALQRYLDEVKRITAEIAKAEASVSAPAPTSDDVTRAYKAKEEAGRAAAKAAKELQQQLNQTYGLTISVADLNALIERGDKAGSMLQRLKPLLDAVGSADFGVPGDQAKALQTVIEQLTQPLNAATDQLKAMGPEFIAAFLPAILQAASGIESLNAEIASQKTPSDALDKYYATVRSQVDQTITSIERLKQVSLLASQTKTGKEFVFEQPVLKEAIDRSNEIGNQAAALPAAAIKANPKVAESLVELRQKSIEAAAAYGNLLAVMDSKASPEDQRAAREELDKFIRRLLEAQAASEREIKVVLDDLEAQKKADALKVRLNELREGVTFTVTGKVQNLDQAKAELQRLQAELGKLDATQRAPIARKIVKLGKLVEAGDLQSLEQIQALIDRINKDVARKQRINLDAKEAREEAKQLAATLTKFRQDVAFTVTGKVQNVEQARAELGRIQSDVDKLKDSQRIEIAPKVVALGELVSGKEIQNLDQVRELIAEIRAALAADIKANVTTAEADAKLKALKERLDALRTEVRFVVTGSFSNAAQVEAEVSKISGEIQKLRDDQKAAFGQRLTSVIDLLGEEKFQEAAIAAKNLRADVEQQMAINVSDKEAQDKFAALQARAAKFREENAFVITGRPQNLEQAENREASLRGEIGTLDRAQRQNFKGLLDDAATAREQGDLEKYIDLLMQIEALLRDQKQLRITTDRAQAEVDALAKKIEEMKAGAAFAITGKVQNAAQAEAEINKIIGSLGRLDEAQRIALQPKIDAAISARGGTDVEAMKAAADDLAEAYNQQLEIKVTTDKAKKAVDDLKASLASIADKIGEPSKPIDRLSQAVDKANAAIRKLPAGELRDRLDADLSLVRPVLRAASAEEAPSLPDDKIDELASRASAIAAEADAARPSRDTSLGAAFGSAERSISSVKSKVLSLQGDLEKLPVPLQAQFIPAINEIRDAFGKLSTSSTQAEIDAVTKKAAGLERALTRAQQAAKLEVTLGESLNTAAFTRVEKQIGFIRAKLLEVGAAANGPVADAFNRYAAFVADAAKKGTLGFASTKEQADQLAEKIGEAAMAAGLFKSKAEAMSFVKGIGDVGRAGVDKYSLALNQAAFAVDDFLSSTGGMEFKLRAISNNITQLAFILGGTTGLFVGLGTVIGAQLAVQLVKWVNGGRTAEDQTKALNDALSRQKSLVEDLANAFRSLGDAMTQGTLSATGQRNADIDRQIEDIRKKQRESAKARAADLDPEVQRERATQNSLNSKLEKEENVGRRIALEESLRASKAREEAAANRAANEVATRESVRSSLERSAEVDVAALPNVADPTAQAARAAEAERIRAAARERAARQTGGSLEDAKAAVESEIRRIAPIAQGGNPLGSGVADVASREILRLKQVLARLENQIGEAATDLKSVDIAESMRGPTEQIRQAQEEVAKAIELGIPNARLFSQQLDANAQSLRDAYKQLEDAQKETGSKRAEMVAQAEATVARVVSAQEQITAQSDAFRFERTVEPQRQTDAQADRARRNLGDSGLGEGRLARRMRELEFNRETLRQQATSEAFQNPMAQRLLQQSEAAINAEIKAIEAATLAIKIFASELDKASNEVKGNLSSAQQAADEARRADLANSTPQTQEARRRAEADLERQRELEQAAQTEINVQRSRLEQQAASPESQRLRDIDEELAGGTTNAEEANRRFAEERATVERDMQPRLAEADKAVSDARERSDRLDAARSNMRGSFDEIEAKAAELGVPSGNVIDQLDGIAEIDPTLAADLDAKLKEDIARFDDIGGYDALEEAKKKLEEAVAHQAQVISEGTARLEEIDAQIAANVEAHGAAGQVPAAREGLIRERDAIKAKMEEDARQAQAKVDAARDASTREAEQAKMAARGRELAKTPDQKFKEETDAGLEDIRQAFARKAEDETGLIDVAGQRAAEEQFLKDREKKARTETAAGRGREMMMTDRERLTRDLKENTVPDLEAAFKEMAGKPGADAKAEEAKNRVIQEQMESVAPMLAQFKQERETAMLQGPSRAALKVTDVATTEGQSELTRLLRGDDAAKDVNLSELQKQSGLLQSVVDAIKGIAFPVVE